jgi:two-component system, cell cycle sensor histidine kinase and response regulator CckA
VTVARLEDVAPAADLRAFFERSPDLICTHDLDGRLLSANPAASAATGYSVEQLMRMNLRDLLTEKARKLYPSYIDALINSGQATGRMEIRTRGGEHRLWEYRNVRFGPCVAGGMARDITERARSYRSLYESESHFRSLVENGPDIISIVSTDGMVCYHSSAAAQDLLGTSIVTLVHPGDRQALVDLMRRKAEGRIEVRMTAKGAVWRSFEVVVKPIVRGTRVTGLLLNARDVTERKMLEQQLEQAHRVDSLGRLAATVAHEFNNVLMGMMPFAELLQKRKPTPDLVALATQHIVNSIQRGKRVTYDILRYTQPAEPALEPLALDKWWGTYIAEAQVLIGDNIHLRTSIEPLAVMADASQLAQVFANLISNARDAMRKGGELSIRVRAPESGEAFAFGFVPDPSRFVQISVSDTGTGMAPEVLAHIFEPLFTTKPNGGTGLGLAVTHQVVTRHGGLIFADSVEGRGSAFHIFLPKASVALPAPMKVDKPAVAARRLLIVDDEEVIAGGLEILLVDGGFEVLIASSGAEALEAIETFEPDLVLLDVGLPDLDGTEVARRIHERRPETPVIFMTGHGDMRAEATLHKPFDIDELLGRIAELEQAS